VYATSDSWEFCDGGGNWASLRLVEPDKFVLIGHDHEYSEAYFRDAAAYFEQPETDLLKDAPDWWAKRVEPRANAEWIGFIYGWDGVCWRRARYPENDGFAQLDLLGACSVGKTDYLRDFAMDAPGLRGGKPSVRALRQLVDAGPEMTPELLAKVVPGWSIYGGVTAARAFAQLKV
jgi:hypothetical protein